MLKDAGVELEAVTGQSTLSSGDAADTWTTAGGYAFTWGDEILAGHLPDSCRLRSISTVYFFETPAANQYCLRIWRLTDGAYSLIGTSAYVSNLSSFVDGHVGIYAGRYVATRGQDHYPGMRRDRDDALRAGHARRAYSVRPWARPGDGGDQPAHRERHDGPADDRSSGL